MTNKLTEMQPKQYSKPLFITYITDLGGESLARTYQEVLNEDCIFFEFNEKELKNLANNVKRNMAYLKRIIQLRKAVKNATKHNSKIIFQNLKPALFTYGLWNKNNGISISDFSHSIFAWSKGNKIKKDIRFYSQRLLYSRLFKIFALTDNLKENLINVYKINEDNVVYISLPLDFKDYHGGPSPVSNLPKVLFVGGEFYRKGGNYLVENWKTRLQGKCQLVILTNTDIGSMDGISIFKNVHKGTNEHLNLLKNSDIFVLPTLRDAYPIVLGEAAGCGLTIITTKFALGAKNIIKHGITGFISDTQEGCIDELESLLSNVKLINERKENTCRFIAEEFSTKKFKEAFFKALS